MDLLPDPKLVNSFYGNQGVPENRAELIAKNYYKKYVMLKEFQQGKTISLYHEKMRQSKLIIYSLIETAKANDIDSEKYLKSVPVIYIGKPSSSWR